jgi:ferredoxin, 2Fe-2S
MLQLHVDDGKGTTHVLTCLESTSVMEAIRSAGLPIDAVCGGSLACSTCHVVVATEDYDRVGAPSEDEEDMLDQAFGVTRTSRLGCQIRMEEALDGLHVRLPERPD